MFGRFYRQLGDRQEAEDLTQEVFLRLYRNRKRYVPSARFTTWLYHIADNVARNALRTRRRRPLHPMPWLTRSECEGGSHEDKLVDSDAIPSQPVEQAELIEVVRDAVARLADRQRSAVEMQFQECSYQEIASELDLSPQAAKSLLYRARHQLRESLSEYAVG
jgi:RNA polymerase sigma-70 factor (ECF subfamily)